MKNNIRSVRFSDEMIDLINEQIGENFTQRFERLVYNCYMLLPYKEQQAAQLDKQIAEEKEKLRSLQERYRTALGMVGALERKLRELDAYFDFDHT